MGMTALVGIDEKKYGKLLVKTLPKVIQNDEEFNCMVELMESIDRKKDATPEENALSALLMRLVQDYDDTQYPVLEAKPYKAVQSLMEQRGLKQVDLVPVIGSRAQVSALVNGKRGISKAQAKKLAAFFGCSLKLFI
jgi:HTH-type transcriptional regulator/antitoxin HigA